MITTSYAGFRSAGVGGMTRHGVWRFLRAYFNSARGMGNSQRRSAVERHLPLPVGKMPGVAVPLVILELGVGAGETFTQARTQYRARLEGSQRIEKVERQAPGALGLVAVGVHVDVEAFARIALVAD